MDLTDFIRKNGLEPTFTRITAAGNHGIVEFGSLPEREAALEKLNDQVFMGQAVKSRPFFRREESESSSFRPRRNNTQSSFGQDSNNNAIYGDIETNTGEKEEDEWATKSNSGWAVEPENNAS